MSCVTWCDYEGTPPPKTDPDAVLCRWTMNMNTFSNWFINQLLGTLSGVAPVLPAQLYVAAAVTASTKSTPGTELTAAGYARMPISFTRVSDIQRWNPSDVTFPNASEEWANIASLQLWDDANPGQGNYYAFGNMTTAFTIPVNKTIKLPANTVIAGIGT